MFRLNLQKSISFFITFFILSLIPGFISAANWSTILKEIKQRYETENSKIEDMTIIRDSKMVTGHGEERTMKSTLYKKSPKFRVENIMQMPEMPAGMPEMKTIIIYDGKDTWMISPTGEKRKLAEKEGKEHSIEGDWWKLLESGKIVSEEKVDGKDCYVVHFKQAEDMPFTNIWFEKEKLYAVKMELSKTEMGKGDTVAYVTLSDYRKVKDDIIIPYKIVLYVNGEEKVSYTVKSVKVNTGLSDDLFDPDKVQGEGGSMQEMMKKMMHQR